MTKYIDLPLKYVTAKHIKFAYREFGPAEKRPLVMLHHLSANLDNWDPGLLDVLAKNRHIIVFDNAGVGASSGKVPLTIKEMAIDAMNFIKALQLKEIDLLGISMGGMVAQELVLLIPHKIKHLILAGTGPRGGVGIDQITRKTNFDIFRSILRLKNVKELLFFTQTPNGKRAAKKYLARINTRKQVRDKKIKFSSYLTQLKAIHTWAKGTPLAFSSITNPVLVVNGDHDRMVPTENSYQLQADFPNSHLIIYPDAGHGSIFQEYQDFAKKLNLFLEDK